MSRPTIRAHKLLPHYSSKIRQWFGNKRFAKQQLGLDELMSDADFYRVIRGEGSKEEEVKHVERALRAYGKERNYEGWREL